MQKQTLINVVLVTPEIPHNTGNIIRLCANVGARLHLIEPLGFDLKDGNLRRAALDYTDISEVVTYHNINDFLGSVDNHEIYGAISDGVVPYTYPRYKSGATILFGQESSGLPKDIISKIEPGKRISIPMRPANRSLNLSNAVAIIVYEIWRQLNFQDSVEVTNMRNRTYFS